MLVVVSYDVSTVNPAGRRRLRRIAKVCEDWGVRVQNSVFECNVDPAQWERLRARMESIIDSDTDSLRYYNLGSKYTTKIVHVGAKAAIDPILDTLVV